VVSLVGKFVKQKQNYIIGIQYSKRIKGKDNDYSMSKDL